MLQLAAWAVRGVVRVRTVDAYGNVRREGGGPRVRAEALLRGLADSAPSGEHQCCLICRDIAHIHLAIVPEDDAPTFQREHVGAHHCTH